MPTFFDETEAFQHHCQVRSRKELIVADAISQTPLETTEIPDTEPYIQVHVDAVLESKHISPQKLAQIRQEAAKDEQLQAAIKFIKHG